MSTSKVFFETKTLSSSESEVGTDAQHDGPSVVSVTAYCVCASVCESALSLVSVLKGSSSGEFAFFL